MSQTNEIISEYEYLKNRIEKLEKNLIPDGYRSPDFELTEKYADQLRGYRLLCHAELEAYFEKIAEKIIENAKATWKNSKNSNFNLTALLINSDKISNPGGTFESKLYKTIQDYLDSLKHNHGIKEENLNKMFKKIGYDDNDVLIQLGFQLFLHLEPIEGKRRIHQYKHKKKWMFQLN